MSSVCTPCPIGIIVIIMVQIRIIGNEDPALWCTKDISNEPLDINQMKMCGLSYELTYKVDHMGLSYSGFLLTVGSKKGLPSSFMYFTLSSKGVSTRVVFSNQAWIMRSQVYLFWFINDLPWILWTTRQAEEVREGTQVLHVKGSM